MTTESRTPLRIGPLGARIARSADHQGLAAANAEAAVVVGPVVVEMIHHAVNGARAAALPDIVIAATVVIAVALSARLQEETALLQQVAHKRVAQVLPLGMGEEITGVIITLPKTRHHDPNRRWSKKPLHSQFRLALGSAISLNACSAPINLWHLSCC